MIPRKHTLALFFVVLTLAGFPLRAQQQQPAAPKDPNDPIERIKDEGMNRSQVMQTLSYLTDVIGPRLTASPGIPQTTLVASSWAIA